MKIVRLVISDIGGIEAFELAPDGSHVVIGGPNGAGKSTVLNAIAGALGGGRNRKAQRVRRGAAKGEVVVDLGDLVVRWRTTAEGRDTLEVASADGATYKSPQAMLDRLWGERAFDPLEFCAAPPKEQARQLAELAGLDLETLDARAAAAYSERTAVNRLAKELASQAADPGYAVPDGTPDEPVDERALAAAVHDAAKANSANAARRAELRRLEADLATRTDGITAIQQIGDDAVAEAARRGAFAISDAEAAVRRAQDALEVARRGAAEDERIARERAEASVSRAIEQAAATKTERDHLLAEVSTLRDVDVAAISAQLDAARATNRAVELRRARAAIEARAEAQRQKSAALTAEIESVAKTKAAAISAARLPIDDLGLEDGAVTWRGVRLESLSGSERLRVSVAIGLARHPEIAVMLIDRWGDLDDDARRIVTEMADAAGCQIITTVVGERDEDITVTIREGRVASQVAASEPAFALDGGREPGEEG